MSPDLEHESSARRFDALLLRAAPSADAPPPYGWDRFMQRSQRHQASRRRTRQMIVGTAAGLLIFISAVGFLGHRRSTSNPTVAGAPDVIEDGELKAAEQWLASLPAEPVVVRVGSQAAEAGLEDRIAQLDDVLTDARVEGARSARLEALQEQRARLLRSLVQVRYAEELSR